MLAREFCGRFSRLFSTFAAPTLCARRVLVSSPPTQILLCVGVYNRFCLLWLFRSDVDLLCLRVGRMAYFLDHSFIWMKRVSLPGG